MLSVEIDEPRGIALLEPSGPLSEGDFRSAVQVIDPWIERNGRLNGLVVHTESFPGWKSFGAFASHLSFVRGHHERIDRIAFATNSAIGPVAERVAQHFVQARVRSFPYADFEEAKAWAAGSAEGSA